ncbi:MAG: S41 family peptidase [Eubacteriales bacterium]|nr:S41 family peptidase [Eubacteriales bacterium]
MTALDRENKGRNKFWKGVLAGALAMAFAGLAVVGVAAGISMIGRTVIDSQGQMISNSASGADASGGLDLNRISSKIQLLEKVADEYFLFDVNEEDMEAGIYKGMLAGLDDPYTTYYTAEEYQAMTEETEGVYCGIGVLISQSVESGIITVLRVFPGSPAEEAGIRKGDILYKVGDLLAYEQDLELLVEQYIRGEEGTYTDLTILRDGQQLPVHVERRMVENMTVESQLLPDKTGYVMVTQFDIVTAEQFIAAVEELESQGMERLVIDLRDNPGGVVDVCVEMAAYILPEEPFDGTILSTANKDGQAERYYCKDGRIFHEVYDGKTRDSRYPIEDGHELDMPIAILMNGMSASASEVFAGALRDYGAAVLVGTTSYGKGIVQSLLPLADGSAVKVTTAHYYTPDGFDLHGKGLEPDVEVKLELDADLIGQYDVPLERDNQVQKAIETLKEK